MRRLNRSRPVCEGSGVHEPRSAGRVHESLVESTEHGALARAILLASEQRQAAKLVAVLSGDGNASGDLVRVTQLEASDSERELLRDDRLDAAARRFEAPELGLGHREGERQVAGLLAHAERLAPGELRQPVRQSFLCPAELAKQLHREDAPRHRPRALEHVFPAGVRVRCDRREGAFQIAAKPEVVRVRDLEHVTPARILLGRRTNARAQLPDAGEIAGHRVHLELVADGGEHRGCFRLEGQELALLAVLLCELPVALLQRCDLPQEENAHTLIPVFELGETREPG